MKSLNKTALVLVGAIIVGGQLYAQPAAPPTPPAASTPAPQQAQLSAEQMKVESQALRDRVRLDIQRTQHLQAVARKAQDIIKLTCVNDKFVKLKAQANLFDTAHRELLGVIETNERFAVYQRVGESAAAVRRAREEADICVGEPDLAGQSTIDYTAPEIIDDPTLGLPFDIAVEPPAYASPYT